MEVASDYAYPNTLPPQLYNLVVVFFIVLFLCWTSRLCRLGLPIQDIRAGTRQHLLLHVDGVSPFMTTIAALSRGHLKQFFRTQRNSPPSAVPRYTQQFAVSHIRAAPCRDDDGVALPFGVTFALQSRSHCEVQAFWGVERSLVGALQKGGLRGLQERLRRGTGDKSSRRARARSSKGSGTAANKGVASAAAAAPTLVDGAHSDGVETQAARGPTLPRFGLHTLRDRNTAYEQLSDGDAPPGSSASAVAVDPTAMLFPSSACLATSPPITMAPASEPVQVTVRAPPSICTPEVQTSLDLSSTASSFIVRPGVVPSPTAQSQGQQAGQQQQPQQQQSQLRQQHGNRRLPLLLVVQPRRTQAWGSTPNLLPQQTGGGGEPTSSPLLGILYDVSVVKFPSSMLTIGEPGPPPAAAQTTPAGGGAVAVTIDTSGNTAAEPRPSEGAGAGAGAGADGDWEGEEDGKAAAPAPAPSASERRNDEPARGLSVSKRWAVTRAATYNMKSVFGLQDGQECIICLSEPKSVILLPCRHMCVCATCFAHIDKCPVCRSQYEGHAVFDQPLDGQHSSDSDSDMEGAGVGAQGATRPAAILDTLAPVNSSSAVNL